MQERTRALLLTDDQDMAESIRSYCPEKYFHLRTSRDLSQLEDLFVEQSPDICFVDGALLPNDIGSLCKTLQSLKPRVGLPIMLLQREDNVEQRVTGFQSGMTDALSFPCDEHEFAARMALQLRIATLELQQTQIIDKLWHARQEAEKATNKRERFLSNLCNQLINEVNTIRSFAETLCSSAQEQALVNRDHIVNKAASVLELLMDTLDLSSLDTEQGGLMKENVYLRELLQALAADYATPCSEKGLRFTCSVDETVPDVIRADHMRLQQVMDNLIDNAIKYTDEGAVSVRLRKGIVRKAEDPTRLYFEVQDTGRGIPEKLIPHITDPFGKIGSLKLEGTGIGLALTSKILALMDSELQIASADGSGTTVSFSFVPEEAHMMTHDSTTVLGASIREVFAVVFAESQGAMHHLRRRLTQTGCTVFGYRPQDLQTIRDTVFVPHIVFVDASIHAHELQDLVAAFGQEECQQALWIAATNEQQQALPTSMAVRVEHALSTKQLYRVLASVAPENQNDNQMLAASISIAQVALWIHSLSDELFASIKKDVDFLDRDELASTLKTLEDGAERNTLLMHVLSANTQYLLQLGSYIESTTVDTHA